MKSKLFAMFVVCATFFGFTSIHLEAVSALPSAFVVALTRGSVNTIALSTNTLGMILSADISSASGTDTQFIGYIEYNCTSNTSPAYTQRVVLSQLEVPVTNLNSFYALYQGSIAGDLTPIQVLTVYSNVLVSSTPNAPTYQASAAVTYGSGTANITANATAAYTNFIGVISIYAVDSLENSISAGTYIANFFVTFG